MSARRRKKTLVLSVCGSAVVLLGAAAILYWQRPQPPLVALAEAHAAIQDAREQGAGKYCPSRLLAAEDSLLVARTLTRAQSDRPAYFLRNYRRAAQAAWDARREAAAAESTAVAVRDSLRQETGTALGLARQALRELREELARVPRDGPDRHSMARLEIALGEAGEREKQQAYREAIALAHQVNQGAARLEASILDRLERYAASRHLWNRWAAETIRWSREHRAAAIIVQKMSHTCDLYVAGRLVDSYHADLGSQWMGSKLHRGDNTTPEGRYAIARKKGPSETKYYKALLLNYPNDDDRRRFALAKKNGELSRGAAIGGLVEIHGHGGRGTDWTQGCVALDNHDMDALYAKVGVGTPVTIVGMHGEAD